MKKSICNENPIKSIKSEPEIKQLEVPYVLSKRSNLKKLSKKNYAPTIAKSLLTETGLRINITNLNAVMQESYQIIDTDG